MNRETWLNAMAAKMAPRFVELGFPLPPFRVAVGFTSAGRVSNIGGECWGSGSSADKHFEIFISPITDAVMDITAILAHELIHAAVGLKEGHKGNFAVMMKAMGMQRPFTNSIAGDAFKAFAQPFIDELGLLPHARLSIGMVVRTPDAKAPANDNDEQGDADDGGGSSNAKPKQKTRMLKASCKAEGCGYTVRLSKKWADELGATCPQHGDMQIDHGEAAEDESEAA